MRLLKRFQSIYFLSFILLFTTKLGVINCVETIPITDDICAYDPMTFDFTNTFELSARVLYLKPNVGDTHFVLTSFDNTFKGSPYPKGKRHQNTPSYDFGYAVEGIYTLCPNLSSLSLQSTFFNTRSTRSISGDFLYDTNGFPGFGTQDAPVYNGTATSANTYQFLSGDLNYNRSFSEFLPDNLSIIIGLHSAYIKFKEHTTSVGTFTNSPRPVANDLHRNSQFWGIGPQIGLDFEMPFSRFCCSYNTFAFRANFMGSLLCGNTKSDLRCVSLRTGPGGVSVLNGDLWRVVSSARADLGINYTLDYSCFGLAIQCGYEFVLYNSCVNKITGLDVAFSGDTIDDFKNFSLYGPYLRISCSF